jgi:hypothetical protein
MSTLDLVNFRLEMFENYLDEGGWRAPTLKGDQWESEKPNWEAKNKSKRRGPFYYFAPKK